MSSSMTASRLAFGSGLSASAWPIKEPVRLRTLIRLVWQLSAVGWIGGGVLLIAGPWMGSDMARHWIVVTLASVFAFGALCNAYATRGRHFGWLALSGVVALAVAGY